jgi:Protein of unknown function DUF2625
MKKLHELINNDEPAWKKVQAWLSQASNQYEVLAKDQKRAEQELMDAQVSTRSPMGAVIYESGGILVDDGWIRILGSGSAKLNRGLMQWNRGKTFEAIGSQPKFLLVADDVIGGYFAINAGALGDNIGDIYYLPPDTLEWESLDFGYSDFLVWAFTGDVQKFYDLFRWKNWKADVAKIDGNQTFSFFPFLWTDYEDFEQLSRKAVPAEENYHFIIDMQKQLAI